MKVKLKTESKRLTAEQRVYLKQLMADWKKEMEEANEANRDFSDSSAKEEIGGIKCL